MFAPADVLWLRTRESCLCRFRATYLPIVDPRSHTARDITTHPIAALVKLPQLLDRDKRVLVFHKHDWHFQDGQNSNLFCNRHLS